MNKTTFPVTYSILSAGALANLVLIDYNIGDLDRCEFFTGGFNDTYRIITTTGATYFMRVYRKPWRSVEDIQYELELLVHLHHQGFPAVCPLPRENGNLLTELNAPEGKRYVALFTEAQGTEPSYDEEPEAKAFQYGQAVARLHNAVQDFSSPHTRFHLDLDHLIDTPIRNIQPFLADEPDMFTHIRQFAQKVRQCIVNLPVRALEQGYCHGDLQGYHHRITADGTLTFFDFDCGGYGFRAYDLAVFRWCARLSDNENVWWEPYLKGYQGVRSLNDLDARAIPLFVCCRYIWHMGVHCQNASDWGCGWLNQEYFSKRIEQLRAAEKDYSL